MLPIVAVATARPCVPWSPLAGSWTMLRRSDVGLSNRGCYGRRRGDDVSRVYDRRPDVSSYLIPLSVPLSVAKQKNEQLTKISIQTLICSSRIFMHSNAESEV
ncbi:hypothetical protein MUK42_28675 [Musa troglodytarum]|uniref:Uncharacterized protein n=1 Tax=Musa troglodytarum TaxID=320322 RepID=A0A9E7JZR7_9LILI|nr:hypothetical protein MUK42_28675 [Musa troglodytarum]